jgi:hypothetical protein
VIGRSADMGDAALGAAFTPLAGTSRRPVPPSLNPLRPSSTKPPAGHLRASFPLR